MFFRVPYLAAEVVIRSTIIVYSLSLVYNLHLGDVHVEISKSPSYACYLLIPVSSGCNGHNDPWNQNNAGRPLLMLDKSNTLGLPY